MSVSKSLACLAFALGASSAGAIDLQPGDLRAPPPDLTFFTASYQWIERRDFYIDGDKVPGKLAFNAAQLQLRLGHSFTLGSMPAYLYGQVPIGYVHPKGDLAAREGDSGVGDTTLLLAAWPYSNRETDSHFGVGAYLTLPTGSYEAERGIFNMGQNRYSAALQAGYQTTFAKKYTLMAAHDAVWWNKNDEFGPGQQELTQKILKSTQLAARYDFNARYSMAANYIFTEGGETRLDDVSRNDTTRVHRYQLTLTYLQPNLGRYVLHYGSDLKTEFGFKERQRILLRYTTRF
jgi:hypothetical protein